MPKVKVNTKVVKTKTFVLELTEEEFKYLHTIMGETTTSHDKSLGFHDKFGYNFYQPLDVVMDNESR